MPTIAEIQEALFHPDGSGNDRSTRLKTGIEAAEQSGEPNFFLIDQPTKTRLMDNLTAAWRAALTKSTPTNTQDLAPEDIAFIQKLVSYVQDNKVLIKEPGTAMGTRLYHTDDEVTAGMANGNFTQMPAVERFLGNLLTGAHFIAPTSVDEAGEVVDLYHAFLQPDLGNYTRKVPGHSHSGDPQSDRFKLGLGDGLGYPSTVTKETAPATAPVINALLVGKNRSGETFLQLESWPSVTFGGLRGRHWDGYDVHQQTKWNLSTYGASSFTEKVGIGANGNAIVLEATMPWSKALEARARALADHVGDNWKADPVLADFDALVRQVAQEAANNVHPAEVDSAIEGIAQIGALKRFFSLAHSWKATKQVFQDSKEAIANDIAGGEAGLRAAIIKGFDDFTKWGSRKARKAKFDTAELVSREARNELTKRIKGDVRAEAERLQPVDRLNYNLNTMLDEVMPTLISNAVYTAALERGRQQMQPFVRNPNAAPHELTQAVGTELSKIDFEGEAKNLIAEWSRRKDALPDEFKEFATEAGEYIAGDSAQDLVKGDVRLRAEREAKTKGDAVFRDAMLPSLRRIAENAKAEYEATQALPPSQRTANEAAAIRVRRMRLRLWKAQAGARRQVRKELRPQLRDFASQIAGKAVESAFKWVENEGSSLSSSRPKGRQARKQGREFADQAFLKIAEFVRNATTDVETQFLAKTGQTQLTPEQRTLLSAAEHIATQAIKANLTSGFTRTLSSVGRWAAEGNGVSVAAQKSMALPHITNKVMGTYPSPVTRFTKWLPRTRVEFPTSWRHPIQAKIWQHPIDGASIRNSGVQPLTRKTTARAAGWVVRQPDVRGSARTAAQTEIAANIRQAVTNAQRSGSQLAVRNPRGVARSNARDRDIIKAGAARARSTFADELRNQLPQAVLDQSFVPSPSGKIKFSPIERMISAVMEPFSHRVTYTKESYSELYAKLPADHQKILPHPDQIAVDNVTLMMADIPAGLADIIADIHAHPMGYDRRKGNYFLALLNKSGDTTRILFGSIPQYCGGDGHYSTANPSPATLVKAYQLDFRVAKQWLELYKKNPAFAAKADLSLTGINFADIPRSRFRSRLSYLRGSNAPDLAFRDPVAYMTRMMLKYPGMFTGVGEITGIKEMVYPQLGKWRWKPEKSDKFQNFLGLANETGQVVVLHNDFGNHGMSATYRPSPAQQNYENLGGLKFVFSQPKYRQVQIVFAHTGIGRLVRPNDSPRSADARYIVKDWHWDEKTGRGSVVGQRTVTVSKNAPEHIHQLYELFQAVPNARVDISWNDVTQAYVELAQANPKAAEAAKAAEAVVQFFLDHQDRILFGSDTVKPVTDGQYNQALITGSPLFAEIARRSSLDPDVISGKEPNAAFKIMRGNYDKALEVADNRVHIWTQNQLNAQLKDVKARSFTERQMQKKIRQMEKRRAFLNPQREALGTEAQRRFDEWVQQLNTNINQWAHQNRKQPEDWFAQLYNGPNPGVMPALYQAYPSSTPLPEIRSPIGAGTSGGGKNDERWRTWGAAGTSVAAVGGAAYGIDWAVHNTGSVLTPSHGGGFIPAVTGSPGADLANAAAFLVRGGQILGRTAYLEKLRLSWEAMFEQGVVNRQLLDRYVSRLVQTAEHLGVTALQRTHLAAITDQFWANYTHLRDIPIDPTRGWTEEQKFFTLHSKVGEYLSTVSREANLQESSLNALDARRRAGRLFRGVTVGTYLTNDLIFGKWLAAGHIDWDVFHQLVSHPDLANAQGAAELSFRLLFGLGNAFLGTREGVALIGGRFGISSTETNKPQKLLQRWGSMLLGSGSTAWTLTDALGFIAEMQANHPDQAAVSAVRTLLEGAFSFYSFQNAKHAYNAGHSRPMEGPRQLAKPNVIVGGALVALEILNIVNRMTGH